MVVSKKNTAKGECKLLTPEKFLLWPLFLLEAATAFFYWFSLRYPFQFDDVAHITKRFAIRHDNPLARWWYNRRWVGDWLNALNFRWGAFDPFVYRLTNLVIHMACGALVYYLVLTLCSKLEESFAQRNKNLISFIAAGFFLLHPLQTQAVSYVIQARIEGVASFFILLNLAIFLRFTEQKDLLGKVFYGGLLFTATVIACGTKEIFVLIPVLMLCFDYFFINNGSVKKIIATRGKFYVAYGLFFAALVAWYVLDFYFVAMSSGAVPTFKNVVDGYMHNQNNLGNVLTHHPDARITSFTFFISQFKAIVHYISLVFWPFRMSVEYDWRLVKNIASLDVLLPFILLASFTAAAVYSLVSRKFLLAGFGFLWFLIVLSPRATIIPSAELVCDYKTYLAVAGIYLILAVFMAWGVEKLSYQTQKIYFLGAPWRFYGAIGVLLFMPLGFASFQRNKVWSGAELFWADCVKKAPEKARVHNNYGVALCEAGKYDKAVQHYEKAIAIDNAYQDPLSNIAVAYTMLGKTDLAVAALERAIKLCPNYPEAYNNIASIFIDDKKLDKAEIALKKAIELRPYYGKAYFNMARLCESRNDFEGVFNNLKKACEGDLDTVADAHFKLGQAAFKLQKFNEAVKAFGRVLQLEAHSTLALFNYANALYLDKQYAQSSKIYERLFAQDQKDYRYANNLAESYFAQQEFTKALGIFEHILKMDNASAHAAFRVAACYENLKQLDKAKDFLASISLDNVPEQFSKQVKQEIARLDLQNKISKDGKISLKDLQGAAALAKNASAEQEKIAGQA